jgi:hypothetical protein
MRKLSIFLVGVFLVLELSSSAHAAPMAACSSIFVKRVTRKAEEVSRYDKFLHCSVSCMLSLRCPVPDVVAAGVLKEVRDLLGYGEPDLKDIQANLKGIREVLNGNASTDQQCLDRCLEIFP